MPKGFGRQRGASDMQNATNLYILSGTKDVALLVVDINNYMKAAPAKTGARRWEVHNV